jgi:CDP-glucose 4,6-dehydratase
MGVNKDGSVDGAGWRGRRVFMTGHTGFKGSWLSLWLHAMGATVRGYALPPPTDPSLFSVARVAGLVQSEFGDIRDATRLSAAIRDFAPDIVLHMAAQPLVRLSYRDPVGTYATNVMGTVHLLEACRDVGSIRAIVVVTTDKCYENREWPWGYRENEPMGGHDPYSNSKGCAELVTSAYRASFFTDDGPALASARAGNVIGGGDWAEDRLVPDVLRAFAAAEPVSIRNSASTRPWQHVLEPLSGYLVLAQALCGEGGQRFAEGWNFGPRDEDARPVGWIVDRMAEQWGEGAASLQDTATQPHEARYLKLDISKAREALAWQPRWSLEKTLGRIIAWDHAWRAGEDMQAHCLAEIGDFAATPCWS